MVDPWIITTVFELHVRISRLQLFQEVINLYLGRCPRLLHFAPLALRPGVFTQSRERVGRSGGYRE
jgi:hypothetical protein